MSRCTRSIFSSLALLSLALTTGCGGEGMVTANFISSAATRTTQNLFTAQEDFMPWSKATRATAQVAQTSATTLTSLQYYVQSIQLCESITVSGTGYSGTSGCTNLYVDEASQSVDLYNSYSITEAKADTTNFVDFLDETSRARLETPVAIDSGTYNYVLINYMRPIKVTASFKTPGDTTVHYTKTAGTIIDGGNDSGGRQLESFQPTGTLTGPAELMTTMNDNGGTFIPLLKPFEVADDANVVVDFVFNPSNFATTSETTAGCTAPTNSPYAFDLANCVSFDLPYAKMQPIPRLAGETTKKEVYNVADYMTGVSAADARIELYYNSADTDKSIRGVDTAIVYKGAATQSNGGGIQALSVSETGGVVAFQGYNETSGQIDATTLTNLTRRQAGTLTVTCNFTGGPCTSVGQTIDYAYTFVGDVTVE